MVKKRAPSQKFPGHSREVVYSTTNNGRTSAQSLDFISDSVGCLLGYEPAGFIENTDLWLSTIHPDDRATVENGWDDVFASGHSAILNYRIKPAKSADYMWVEDEVKPRFDGVGSIIGVAGSLLDCTENKRLEEALSETELQLRGLFSDAGIGTYRTTPDGRISMANQTLLEMLGYRNLEELSARNLNEDGYEPRYPRDHFRRLIESEGSIRGLEAAWTRKDGTTIFVREYASVVRDREGRVMYYQGTVEDITERKKVERKTERINNLLKLQSAVRHTIMHESQRDRLFAKVCEAIVQEGGYRMAWIGLLDAASRNIVPVAWRGEEEGYLAGNRIAADDTLDGSGPAGKAIRSGEACVCNDVESDPSFEHWRSAALGRGYRAAGSFPMHFGETIVGVVNLYSVLKDSFTQEEIYIMSDLANDIGFALWANESRSRQEAANEVIRDREFWLKESQRVARIGSYVYEVGTASWSGSAALYDLMGIDSTYRRDFKYWLALIYPNDRAGLLSEIRNSFLSGTRLDTEFRIVRASDKGVRWMWGTAETVLDSSGQAVKVFGTVQDITDRKRAEEDLRNERILLRTLVDNLPNSIYVKDKGYRKVLANPSNVKHVGMSSEADVLGKTDFDLYPRELAEKFFRDDRRVIELGESVIDREEFTYDEKGKQRWQLTSKLPLRDEEGNVVGIIGIGTDITERRRAEEEKQRERVLLKTLFYHLPASIWVKDKDYRRTAVNKAHVVRTALFSGRPDLSEEDFVGKTDFNIYDSKKAERYFEEDQSVIRNGRTILNREELVVDSKGVKHWQLVSKVPLSDENGSISGLIGIVTDITMQKEAEEVLARERALLRTLIDNLPNEVFVKDRSLRKLIANPAHLHRIERSIGTKLDSESQVIGKTDFDVYPEEAARRFAREDKRIVEEGVVIINRERHSIDADGQERWELISKIPLRDDKGEIAGFVGIANDITEQKRVEEALRTSKETLARITRSIKDVIYSIDGTTGELEYISPAFEKLFGYSVDDVKAMGGRWAFLRAVIEDAVMPTQDPLISKKGRHHFKSSVLERRWRCKDGSELFIEDHSVPIYDGDRLVRIDGVLRDITERKLAEDEVEKERILLRTLIDNLPYAVYVKDRDLRKVIANPVDVYFAGAESELEIVGKRDSDIYPEEIAQKFLADDRKVIEDGKPVINREERVIDAHGKEHWILTTKVPLRNKGNHITGLVGVGVDVTEKRAVDEALRQSEAELRALFESMNDVIIVMDADGRYLKVAPTDPSLLYVPADEMIGKTVFDVLPKKQAAEFFAVVGETIRSRKTQTIEYPLQINGEQKWRAANVSPMTENTVIWVARDVTERKSMEREIVDSEKEYRELVENALVGVYKVNLSGTIIYVNKAMADMLEFDSPLEMMSVTSSSLYRNQEDMADLVEDLRKFGKTGKNKEVEMVTKSGKLRNVLVSASLDKDVISGMAKDITEIRTLERQFIQTQKLEGLGNIAAGIAHDFNNILGVIIGYSDLLGQSAYETEKFGRGMNAIAKAADRGKSLVRQLLTFARKTEVTFESLILNGEVAEIKKLVEETFPRTIEVRTSLSKKLPPVLADATQIHQVLLNLCVNARDAMPKGGCLTVSTGVVPGSGLLPQYPEAKADRYVELKVTDTGTGMDDATRQRIFEPFFTTKGVGKGTGLGLSVVYGIVESHGGFIDVRSEPGKGTTFVVYLPVLGHTVDPVDLGKEASGVSFEQAGTILVIEDEDMLRELLRSVLTSGGHAVLLARDGDEGVAAFLENKDRVDLVISDLGLPKLGGEEVVRRIRKISGEVKIAVASGFINPLARSELEKEGVAYFIQKPYRTSELLRIVNELLKGTERRNF